MNAILKALASISVVLRNKNGKRKIRGSASEDIAPENEKEIIGQALSIAEPVQPKIWMLPVPTSLLKKAEAAARDIIYDVAPTGNEEAPAIHPAGPGIVVSATLIELPPGLLQLLDFYHHQEHVN